jgi:hypothetical protein
MHYVGAYEGVAATLITNARELSVARIEGDLGSGELVTLTQDLYIRRVTAERGAFRARLDSDRTTILKGRFSTGHLIGSTGQTETFGHHRFTMLAYVAELRLDHSPPEVELRPLFIGWRLEPAPEGLPPIVDDRREVWPQQIDQFAKMAGSRPGARDMKAVAEMPEEDIERAFAEIVGEPFVPKDWGGEASDLVSSRVSIGGEPLSAAFAFKGPSHRGRLYIANMGKRGDQALRLAHEPVDLFVVQHHDAVDAAVRNLLSALARQHGKRFMVIDGAATATILRAFDKLAKPRADPDAGLGSDR